MEAQRTRPDRAYGNLQDAIGTNDIRGISRSSMSKRKPVPPRPFSAGCSARRPAASSWVSTCAAARVHGGMDTSKRGDTGASVALDNAIEVLRKRVDKFGVAEPIIQPAAKTAS